MWFLEQICGTFKTYFPHNRKESGTIQKKHSTRKVVHQAKFLLQRRAATTTMIRKDTIVLIDHFELLGFTTTLQVALQRPMMMMMMMGV
jgi:hypothetical protein